MGKGKCLLILQYSALLVISSVLQAKERQDFVLMVQDQEASGAQVPEEQSAKKSHKSIEPLGVNLQLPFNMKSAMSEFLFLEPLCRRPIWRYTILNMPKLVNLIVLPAAHEV